MLSVLFAKTLKTILLAHLSPSFEGRAACTPRLVCSQSVGFSQIKKKHVPTADTERPAKTANTWF